MYVKLFRSILTSTVWMEPAHVLRAWLAILLLADSEGYLLISVPGLAKEAHISIDECRDALAKLEAPDPESQHREEEGRRIIRIGGEVPAWHIVNYSYYRSLRDEDLRREYMREYQKDYRRKKKAVKLSSVNPSKPRLAQAEAEAEEESTKDSCSFETFYNPYLRHDARQDAEKAWAKLSMQDRIECLEKTPAWVKAKAGTEIRFIPLPATYLNKKRWRDPLEDLTEKVGGSSQVVVVGNARKCFRCENAMTEGDLIGSAKFCRECRKKGAI